MLIFDEDLKNDLINRILKADPYKIILFGSRASGKAGDESDIDLYVVVDDDFMPANYREKSDVYLRVSNLITEVEKKIPVDLIVHTMPMYKKFIENGSMFSKVVTQEGVCIYEKNNSRVA